MGRKKGVSPEIANPDARMIQAVDDLTDLKMFMANHKDILLALYRGNTTEEIIQNASSLEAKKMLWLSMNAKSEKVRLDAARTLLYMAGYKPVEKSMNLNANVNRMNEAELDSLIKSKVKVLSPKERRRLGLEDNDSAKDKDKT